MLREQAWMLLDVIPAADMTKTVLVLRSAISINVDTIFRRERDYLMVRGREAGSNDEGRAFFLPYEEISYIKIERLVRLNELRGWYGQPLEAAGLADGEEDQLAATAQTPAPGASKSPIAPAAAIDPAAIAKQNLLDRIRHARTAAGKK